jgi:rod shape determining protein RodA
MPRKVNVWKNIDWSIVFLFLVMVTLGWLNIYASVYNEEHQSIFDISQRYGKQLLWIAAALVLGIMILLVDSSFFVFFSYVIYGIVVLLLIIVLIFGREINGSKSWFVFGEFGFQPSEFSKFATALVLARFVSSFSFRIHSLNSLAGLAAIFLIPVFFIILQNDTGSALVFFAFIFALYREGLSEMVLLSILLLLIIFILSLVLSTLTVAIILVAGGIVSYLIFNRKMVQFWTALIILLFCFAVITALSLLIKKNIDYSGILIAGSVTASVIILVYSWIRKLKQFILVSWFFLASVLFSISVEFVITKFLEPHQQTRIYELLGMKTDPKGIGYHVNQSKIAIGSGGLWGKGFLQGTQTKYNFVPEQDTDFIFCTVAEEWGLAGSLLIIGLFLWLLIKLVFMAEKQRSKFSRVYGYSVASIIFFHFLINIGMTMGIMPVIGIPLPFFSYGGSSLWSFTILLFIFIRLDASRLENISN